VYSLPVPRRAGRPLKAKPTTVRLEEPLDQYVRERALSHPDGQSGVINDAVRLLKASEDSKTNHMFSTIVNGANGSGSAQPADPA
jgi:hypothetical protein